MLEQPDTGESRGVAIVSLKLALSQDARASLAAVRVAQESAQRRARQQTMQARLWLALLAGAVALGAVTLRPRVAQWRQSRAKTAKPAQTSPRTPPAALGPAAPAAMAHAAQPASAAEPAIAKPAAPVVREPEPSVPSAAAVRAGGTRRFRVGGSSGGRLERHAVALATRLDAGKGGDVDRPELGGQEGAVRTLDGPVGESHAGRS